MIKLNAGVSYDLPGVLERILTILARYMPCDTACIGLRYGDNIRLEAVGEHGGMEPGWQVSINENAHLAEIIRSQAGVMICDICTAGPCPLMPDFGNGKGSWICIPLLVGKRAIGIVCLVSAHPNAFDTNSAHQAELVAKHIAPLIETTMALAEASQHLEKLAILNELASAASISVNADEVARRIIRRLRRIFDTDLVSLLLLSPDGKTLREFGEKAYHSSLLIVPVDRSLSGYVIETGLPMRLGDVGRSPRYFDINPGVRSELTVPLKYRGKVIGVMNLESNESNAFSSHDEQLLVVIASHLAGLIENVRLHAETRKRARDLELLHKVAARVVGLTDIAEISQTAADLMAEQFVYELAAVLIADESGEYLVVEGVGGAGAHLIKRGYKNPIGAGITGQVIRSKKSRLVNDTSLDPDYVVYSGWQSGSEMCVPLYEGDQILGVINVERVRKDAFSDNDLLVLEALAGTLSSVIMNALRYQQLQAHIESERITNERLIQSARLAAVGEMAAGVAHELNNPLTTVAGFVELVLDDIPADSPQRADLELVLREAWRAREVVRRLLDFSRPGEGFRDHADLNDILSDVIALVQHLAHTSRVEFRLELWNDLPRIMVDREQIKQVLLNLLHNAHQSMPNGGILSLTTMPRERDDQEWVTVKIQDTGQGISPENLGRIFEPFFSTQPPGKGTGLGLSVSYGIIQDHGGMIDVSSTPGKGSIFMVWLPVHI
ncbi:MAG: GAF domain-containing protein [Chloroflexi bacterium]|nr:GAF domain-containing protein [Chloroflexota bacterium]MBU1661555.1 GAF domain-containing protein [Chloroflexota bacterium]